MHVKKVALSTEIQKRAETRISGHNFLALQKSEFCDGEGSNLFFAGAFLVSGTNEKY